MKHYGIDVSAERRSILPAWDIEYEGKFIYSEAADTLYYGSDTEWVTASGGGSPLGHIHDDRYYTETEVDDLITTISGKLDDHDELNNLDYASAGHTGFQPAGDYLTESEIDTISGTLNTKIDGKDNYSSWSFAVDGVTKDAVTTGDVLDFVGGDNIIVTRSADDQITVSGTSAGLVWTVISSNTNAVKSYGYLINATGGNITLTLPVTPSEGDMVGVSDFYEKATTNVITVARNDRNIESAAEDLIIDIDGSGITLAYTDITKGWKIVNSVI